MIRLFFATILAFSINTLADEEDKVEFDYSAFEINLVQTDSTGVGIKVAFPLPGGLYLYVTWSATMQRESSTNKPYKTQQFSLLYHFLHSTELLP